MSDEHDDSPKRGDDHDGVPGRGDDERENREQIEETGEPATDALGNADGVS